MSDLLNRYCHCISVDKQALGQTLDRGLGQPGAYSRLVDTHPNLLADSPVFVARDQVDQMTRLIESVETVVALAAFRSLVLERAPATGRIDHGPRGVFFGYDFHLTNNGPKLIEINTNAGGALLLLHVARAQQACCREVDNYVVGQVDIATLEQELIAMFRQELRFQFQDRELRRIAIVDTDPDKQFLGPEFTLFRRMFEREGIHALVAGPEEFTLSAGELQVRGQTVDLVYNRMTDFYLQSPESRVLDQAYRDGVAAFTPNPFTHALYANKQNLIILSDPDALSRLGADRNTVNILSAGIPKTTMVTEENADSMWSNRRRLFFKPIWGFGSKGTYRGSKLTRRKWQSILESEYVAQEMVAPSERVLILDGDQQALKLDVRCYVYNGRVQLLGARMYRGQTTNFRTQGGGLAAVFTTSNFPG